MESNRDFLNIRGRISCLAFISVILLASKADLTQITAPSIQDLLRHRIEAGGVPVKISIDQERIYSSIVLPVFYEKRVYRPAWTETEADLHNAVALLKIIREVDREGLRPMGRRAPARGHPSSGIEGRNRLRVIAIRCPLP